MNGAIHGSLSVRTAIADALLAGVSPRLGRPEIDAVLEAGFDATNAAVRNGHPLLDFDEYIGRRAL